jgi:hypothetical protein
VVAGPEAIGRHRLVRPVHSSGSLGTSSHGAPVDTDVARATLAQDLTGLRDHGSHPLRSRAQGHAWFRLVAAET